MLHLFLLVSLSLNRTATKMMDPEKKKWSVLYPVYLNSKKTAAEGRKIAKTKACENPTPQEISMLRKHLGFKCELEVPAPEVLLLSGPQ